MKIERIITLANEKTRLDFTVMERSLRATGCNVPLEVIPYNNKRFNLPPNSSWLEAPAFYDWVDRRCAHPMMRKYLPLTMSNYQYCDSDIVFLENPCKVLSDKEGFIVACTEWNKPQWTVCEESRNYLASRYSTWQQRIFCAGQFACDRALYSQESLIEFSERLENQAACLRFPFHDQPGTNLMVLSTEVPLTNLTLPPYQMESTMAVDYQGDYAHLWENPQKRPYLIHYAGGQLDNDLPINKLFFDFLTREEREVWDAQADLRRAWAKKSGRWPYWARLAKRLISAIDGRFELCWRSQLHK